MARSNLSAFAALLALGAGCTAQIYSPPPRLPTVESARTVGEGRVALAARGSFHAEVYGPAISGGSGRIRYGVNETSEVFGEATLLWVDTDNASGENPSRFGGSLHGGFKQELGTWVSLFAGAGAGIHAFGGFLAPELGTIFAYENRYFVPLAVLQVMLSVPVGSRERIIEYDSSGTQIERHSPSATFYASIMPGFRVPLIHHDEKESSGGIHEMSLFSGFSFTFVSSQRSRIGFEPGDDPSENEAVDTESLFGGFSAGVEVSF